MLQSPPLTTPPPAIQIRQTLPAVPENVIGYTWADDICTNIHPPYPSIFPALVSKLPNTGSPLTCYESRTLWTAQSAAWGCSKRGKTFAPATACSTDAAGQEMLLYSGTGGELWYVCLPRLARTDALCRTHPPYADDCYHVLSSQASAAHCYVGTIMEFPDHAGAARTGAACDSVRRGGIVVYADTKTGVARDTPTSAFSSTVISVATSMSLATSRSTGLLSAITGSITSSTTPVPTTINMPAEHKGLSSSDKIALGVGVGVGVGIGLPSAAAGVVYMAVVLRKYRRRRRKSTSQAPQCYPLESFSS